MARLQLLAELSLYWWGRNGRKFWSSIFLFFWGDNAECLYIDLDNIPVLDVAPMAAPVTDYNDTSLWDGSNAAVDGAVPTPMHRRTWLDDVAGGHLSSLRIGLDHGSEGRDGKERTMKVVVRIRCIPH